MRSVADSLRAESRRELARLTPEARLELALKLGDADVDALSKAQGLTIEAARTLFAQSRRIGRRPSRAHDE